ncbi:MAG TPA: hypothetical protein DCG14_05350 [Phycisphaerales bacterium]|nr:hypothetical protein [Phycisphaerales bacterium]
MNSSEARLDQSSADPRPRAASMIRLIPSGSGTFWILMSATPSPAALSISRSPMPTIRCQKLWVIRMFRTCR